MDEFVELDPRCPACGDVIDFCQGHGEIGDPIGFQILENHDAGYHYDCDPEGCGLSGSIAIGSS